MLKIGDEIVVHGYVDEIREDVIIIRNSSGYFGTSKAEVFKMPMGEDNANRLIKQFKCGNVQYKSC